MVARGPCVHHLLVCLPLAALAGLGGSQPQRGPPDVPACVVPGAGRQEVACGEGAGAECMLAGRFRFPAQAIEHRGDVNDNAMIRGGEGIGKLVAKARDMYAGEAVFLKCAPAPEGRGTVGASSWPSSNLKCTCVGLCVTLQA
jgi:hypothetical protein